MDWRSYIQWCLEKVASGKRLHEQDVPLVSIQAMRVVVDAARFVTTLFGPFLAGAETDAWFAQVHDGACNYPVSDEWLLTQVFRGAALCPGAMN
jgi:hypothetical protein